jgi:drug/metabolite transporter (DMT)-like permease
MSHDVLPSPSAPDPLDSLPIALVESTDAASDLSATSTATHSQLRHARLLVLIAALLWSTSGFFVKAPYFEGWPGATLAFWRALFASFILWPLVRRPEWTWKLIPMTLLFAAMNFSYLTAMATGTAANAIWLQFTAPAWVLVIGVFVFKERAIARDWLLVAFAAAGVSLILYHESQAASQTAVAWGLASGIAYAGVVLSLRHLRMHDPTWLAAVNHTATAILFAPFIFTVDSAPFPAGIQWLLLAALGVFQMGVPYILFARGLQRIPGHEATGIGLVEPILVPLWTFLAWNERPAWWTLAGGALILAGLAIRYLKPPASTASPANSVSDASTLA